MKYQTLYEKSSPSPAAINQIEEAIGKIMPDRDAHQEWYLRYAATHKTRLAFDLEQVRAFAVPTAKIIEIGSVPLILTVALAGLAYEVTGVDISPERFASSINALKLDVRKADIETEELPVEKESFDVVIFNEVFEHLRINLIETLRKILHLLKPGGVLLLSTPNLLSLTGYANLLVYKKGPGILFDEYAKLENLGHMGHVREYSVNEVCHFLKMIGFEIEQVVYRGKWNSQTIWKRVIMSGTSAVIPSLRPHFSVIAQKRR